MDRERLAVGLAGIGSLGLVALAALPYALFYPGAVESYYAVGLLDPRWIALLSVVVVLSIAAGLKRRSDPATMAGVAVTLSVFAIALAASWALPARTSAQDFQVDPIFGYHPHAVAVAALALAAGSGLYAYLLFEGS